ncbi:RagB/SusD family nutrient uptake outer membrane protein [Flavilitoribacter nigricans]|uniref:RagB/SusD family nutrient uptake outer membrane protein n=1 Tax=Flavilitoribacter nigricans (strain ATCC 23147 / DSM 23189 / NBRC 102662 / NCIMB 1420 / SS-2) TaxID=1122177 RepID=A0A2D0NB02_FLAN2|nr:RagB/SusD family nutrient uptake outer membrane protein [Flavilitoribacter nigricans]PHN05691.1 RagB/SusD family nutrient uptake outer membrane protein [Flavilitoribacter nigricans DSM 23189 = NBRC 102662]
MKKSIKYLFSLCLLSLLSVGCEDVLDVVPPGEFSPGNVLNNEAGLTSLLFSAYRFQNLQTGHKNLINMEEVTTDMAFNTGGGENRTLSLFINFTWDPSVGWIQGSMWNPHYNAIRDANIILENIETADIQPATASLLTAEARYIRASEYAFLYNWFGPVPLRTSTSQEESLPRAREDELLGFIESELEAILADLPDPGQEPQWGRATKGHALGILTKFYLNTKQWAKVVETTQRILDLNYYELFPVFKDLFKVENEGNKELLVAWPQINDPGSGNTYPNGAFPPNFSYSPLLPEYVWSTSMANWATQYRLRDDFVDSYAAEDQRLITIVQEYVNRNGDMVNLRNNPNNSRSLKYFDPAAVANFHGNDSPIVRFADILLSRAEALNELNGPSQEALDLINQVRSRAGLPDLTLADAGSKEILRDRILAERGWEFVSEGKRREDLIRHGNFIERAQNRGISAQPHHVLFPIPAAEINANPAVEQNPGY